MSNIFSDRLFWAAVAFIIIGIILFVLINKSVAAQKKRLGDPQKNFEKLVHSRGFIVKGGKRGYVAFGRIIPMFIIVMGIIMLIVMIMKY